QLLAGALHPPAQQPGHVDAVDRLHHQVVAAILEGELEHLDDVGMDEPRRDVRLIHEHPHELRLPRQARVNALDHKRALEGRGAFADGAEHFRHPAAPYLLREPVFHGTTTLTAQDRPLHLTRCTTCWKVVAA